MLRTSIGKTASKYIRFLKKYLKWLMSGACRNIFKEKLIFTKIGVWIILRNSNLRKMASQFGDLSELARITRRKSEIRNWVNKSVDEHLAKRALRANMQPPIHLIDESVDGKVIAYDQEAWQQAIAFYKVADKEREMLGVKVNAVETNDGFRCVTSSTIDDVATALLRFRKYFTSDFEKERPPALLDMGCNDGRVVVLAYILGYRAEGIEIDDVAYREASGYIQMLDRIIPGLARAVSIVQGDYSTSNGVRNLRTRLKFVDVFFNYDDTNVDKIAEVILRRGKQGAKLLLHSYSERKDQVPLKLSHMIKLGNEGKAYRVDYPVFDVFVRER